MTLEIAVLPFKLQRLGPTEYASVLEDRLPDASIRIAGTPEQERTIIETAEIATGTGIDQSTLESASALDLFAGIYSGTEHLPLAELADRGIAVTNGAGVHGPNIAEYVVGGLLAFARGFPRAWGQQQRREYRAFETRELQGSTVTVIGLGAIGTAVLERLEPFGVETIGLRYSPEKGGPAEEIAGFDRPGLHEALSRSEYVVVATPLTDETRGLIDESAFAAMPATAVLVNVARGPIVDTDALLKALQRNGIGGAVLDVTDPEPLPPDHELWRLDNVLLTPHHAGFTPQYFQRRAEVLAKNVDSYRETGSFDDLENQVQ